MASKRESPLSIHYRLFTRTHVPDIVVTSGKEAASSSSKEGIIEDLKVVFGSLEETIWSSTEKKISVDKLIVALPHQKEDEDLVEDNVNVVGNDDKDVGDNEDDGNDDQEESEVEA